MKKILLPMAVAAVLFSLASCKDNREEDKKKFVNTCMEQGGNQMTGEMKGFFQEYCECSAEKVLDKYSQKEIDEMEADAKKTGSQDAMMAKLMPVVQPCLDDLQKKAASAMPPASAPAPAQ